MGLRLLLIKFRETADGEETQALLRSFTRVAFKISATISIRRLRRNLNAEKLQVH
jgi:hypothetical protein